MELNKTQRLWLLLRDEIKCPWCKANFPEGIIAKHPNKIIPTDALAWFTMDFLLHAQTTHGYDPETLTDFIEAEIKYEETMEPAVR